MGKGDLDHIPAALLTEGETLGNDIPTPIFDPGALAVVIVQILLKGQSAVCGDGHAAIAPLPGGVTISSLSLRFFALGEAIGCRYTRYIQIFVGVAEV